MKKVKRDCALYSVKKIGQLSGVSVRTLHYYDAFGLLKPCHVGANGYRFYSQYELVRLQQIIIYRQMDLSLATIKQLLDGNNQVELLQGQKKLLVEKIASFQKMLQSVHATLEALEGDKDLKIIDLYSGYIEPDKQAEYESQLIEYYGKEASKIIKNSMPENNNGEIFNQETMQELQFIETALANSFKNKQKPDAANVQKLISQHWAWVLKQWRCEAPCDAYLALADSYENHPDFIARYEAIASGFTVFLTTAIRHFVHAQSKQF
ncbi:MerR family transcriptional regulator [Bartonella sp. HY406]|uniref:MerR family transcriptional regulator n=1 Tax=Bartonella sp. HY406 TaxID=2979331 RepID=UPI0021C60CC8|nr:MerR family transcriptional regulator [Bartonella sp. HY406]UXN02545.1 MerR family transcriptional regulator [Bartonella sp. HY406]